MTPRPKVDADPVATATMERIGRDFKERLEPPKGRGQWGAFALALAIGYLAATLAGKQSGEGPVAVASRQVTPRATPTYDLVTASAGAMIAAFDRYKEWYDRHPALTAPGPVGGYFNVEMPDGRRIHSTVRSAVAVRINLPFTGNRMGDARYVTAEGAWYVWLLPIGGNTATWIDP
jgi:hypothetical protein